MPLSLASIKGALNAFFIALHTLFWCIPLYILFFLRLVCPNHQCTQFINRYLIKVGQGWIASNTAMMKWTMDIKIDQPNFNNLHQDQSYFIICNHQSWTDIIVLQKIFAHKIPFIRFFIKKELLKLPAIGLAWLAFDFPIMHRYSKEKLAKHPELRGKDLAATQRACDKYQHIPVTILNFLEGTRFTSFKHQQQHSPYKHLLNPKSGGFAFTINAMKKKITHILDITIAYPEGRQSFWDFLCGRVHQITIKIKEYEIPSELLEGSYTEDPLYNEKFKQWVQTLWSEKDIMLETLLK